MPAVPLLDPGLLDLSKPSAATAAAYARLKQAPRLALLDGVAAFDPAGEAATAGWKEIRGGDWWAEDHIPGRPIFPGVLMCETAAQLCTWDFMERHPEFEGFLGFGGMDNTRFRGIVEPPKTMVYACKAVKVRSKMFVYAAQGWIGAQLVFETEIIGVVV